MKKIYNKRNFLYKYSFTFIALFLLQINAFAGRGEFKKTIQETFEINVDTRIEAINKRGDIHIHTWDKDEVSFEITITVEARTEADAEEEFDRINVEFSNVGNIVSAETIWGDKEKNGKTWFSWTWNDWEDGKKTRVDYVINMPANNPVNLDNKYGHINFPKLNNNADITVKYGNMNGEHVGGDFDLNIGYGDACLQTVSGESDINIKYGKFCADELAKLEIESKYSKIDIDNARNVNISSKYDNYEFGMINDFYSDGKYDDFRIERANNIKIDSKYSDYRIEELTGTGYLDMEYGNAKINQLAPDFGDLRIDGSYAHFKINISSGTVFDIDAESSYGDIDLPDEQHLNITKDGAHKEIEGYIGSPNSGNRIRARLRYGDLDIF